MIKNLEALGINTSEIIFDAGYSTLVNLTECLESGIDFITRLAPNYILYREGVEEAAVDLISDNNAVTFSQRLLYIRKIVRDISGKPVFVYVGLDEKERHTQLTTLLTSAKSQKMTAGEVSKKNSGFGYFVLVSSKDFASENTPRENVQRSFDTDFYGKCCFVANCDADAEKVMGEDKSDR